MSRTVGIDLGTTNSVVAVLTGGEPEVIANSEGSRTTPSVVAFAKNGEVLVGEGDKEQTILVFDLGGGTFDVSLLEIGDGVIEVKATNGDNHLGGDDWDERVIKWLVDKFKAAHGIDLTKDKMAMQRLREAAEKAKIELSASQQTSINLPYITVDAEKNPLFLDEQLSRAEFQRITSDLLERTKVPFQNVLRDAGISLDAIDHVVLVGGSTRMPAVVELVRELTGGKEPNQGVNPDEV